MPHLTLIPAGAGSGKTYRIKEQLADWVETGLVKPDRIAAVTFTESAASELRERIRTTLMMRGRLEDALRLDQSFISTIHGFGNRLLVEYAFEAGSCPTPRLLAEDEEQLLLRKAIARIDRIEPLSRSSTFSATVTISPAVPPTWSSFVSGSCPSFTCCASSGGMWIGVGRLKHCLGHH